MRVVELEPNGDAPWEVLRKYGGKFSFFQKIKMGGVGSPKIVYTSGLPEMDALVEDVAGSDICYLNFEFLKNGLLARVNKTQHLFGIFITFDEINVIEISQFEKRTDELGNTSLAFAGQLKIFSLQGQTLVCQVIAQSYEGTYKYFQNNKSTKHKLLITNTL